MFMAAKECSLYVSVENAPESGWPDEFVEKKSPNFYLTKLIYNFCRGSKIPKKLG
jgi:hypothetical protein